jgi:hypothetical protein
MAKTSGEIEKEFIDNLKLSTGKVLNQWLVELKNSKIEKRNDIIKWLKESQGFGHMNASLLVGIYLNGGKLVYGSEANLLENQIEKYESLRPLFEFVSQKILNQFPDCTMIPKKTYISFTVKREFAAMNIKANELRLGMDLGSKPFSSTLEKSKLTGPMPRISHMVILKDQNDFDDNVVNWLTESYNRVNS